MFILEVATVLSLSALALAAPNASVPIASGTGAACSELSNLFGDSVLYPNTTDYTTENLEYWDRRATLHPGCIFRPADADQVASAVAIFNTHNAQFAVRGGGHMNYPGSNNINGGVLLALTDLNKLQVSNSTGANTTQTIHVGPGNRWVDVYGELDKYGLYAIGGRLKAIGVPGLTLIGGVHYFINKYGFAMDNVVSYDVVLGNGTQVVASATENKDLFWALKGGANNFGIVTNFELKTYPIPQVSTTIQAFNESQIRGFIEAACGLAENDDSSLGAGAVITLQYNATTKVASASLLGVQEGTESPPSKFKDFTKLPALRQTFNVTSPKEWHSLFDAPNQMFRVQFGQHTIKPDPEQLFLFFQLWKEAVDEISDVKGLYPTFVLNTAPKTANTIAKTNGIGNVWGLDDKQSRIWWQISTGWDSAEDDLRMNAWGHALTDRLHRMNQEKGLSTEFVYMGDAGDYQNPFLGFPSENVEKMRAIRDVYDANSVFTRLNWGGFKLGA